MHRSPYTDTQPTTHRADAFEAPGDERRHRPVALLATASLLLSGLSLAVYALTAFTTRDWAVAGPGLLVAAAGVAGLRNRWFHLAGLVPIGAVLSVAGPILAYDLARPQETWYLVGSVLIIVGACAAAIFGVASALDNRRSLPIGIVGALIATPIVFVAVIGSNPASADATDGVTDAERIDAVDVELVDVSFAVDTGELVGGTVLHLRNTGTLPHDFTIPALDVAVFVPPGRDTYARLPDSVPTTFEVICTVGDHRERGMRLDVATG